MIRPPQTFKEGPMGTRPTIGQMVRLVSGGPLMTAYSLDMDPTVVWATWFDNNNQLQRAAFDYRALHLVELVK